MNYMDKYKGQYGRNSVYDILSLNPNIPADWEVINREYRAVDIEKVVIDGDTFTHYKDFQFIWEKSYVKSPVRSGNGSMGNLNSYATFVTPHLIINFSIMSIDDYRRIMRKDLERNEFVVECYDPIYNEIAKVKMYFAPAEMAKLFNIAKVRFDGERWEEFIELVGVQDYTVELIGTNADLDLVSVRYIVNAPDGASPDFAIDEGEEDVYKGEEIIIGGGTSIPNETFGGAYKFTKWNVSPDGGLQGNYINGYAYTINTNLVLYAQWEETKYHTLTFNYGLADQIASENPNKYPTQRTVAKGKSIGTIPDAPYISVEGEYSSPYGNGAWYRTPTKGENSVPIKSEELYWFDRDSAIYLLYDTEGYRLTLQIKVGESESGIPRFELYQFNNDVKYNTPLNLPNLVKSGYTFDGWYTFSDFREGTKYTKTTMAAHDLTLYARWLEE